MRPLQRLTLEAMIDLLSDTFDRIPDSRCAKHVDYSLPDTLMSGAALIFFQHPSLLEFQRKMHQHRGRYNLEMVSDALPQAETSPCLRIRFGTSRRVVKG